MTPERCFSILERNQIPYSHSIHPPAWTAREVAAAEHMHGDNGYGMLMLPADDIVSFGDVLHLLGLREIRLATETELGELFPDSELGAMPPFGNLVDMPVLLDETLASSEFIAFSAGTHRDVIHMSFASFCGLVNPLTGSFAVSRLAIALA